MFSFLCREDCSHQWRRLPKWGVHCKLQWGMVCQRLKVCNILLANCIIINFLPTLPPPPCPALVSWVEHNRSGVWALAKHLGDLESISLPAAILCIWAGRTPWGMSVPGELRAWEVLPFCRQQMDKLTQGEHGMTISPSIQSLSLEDVAWAAGMGQLLMSSG